MADLPWAAYPAIGAGPFKTLSALWRHVSGEALWSARAEARRPWACPKAETLARLTGRSKRSVESDLGRLRDAGWISRAWGEIEGRRIYGWELIDLEGVDADIGQPAPVADERTEETCGPAPKKPAGSPRKASGTVRSRTEAACGVTPQLAGRAAPGPELADGAPSRARPPLRLLTEGSCGAADDAAAAVGTPHRSGLRGQPAAGCGAVDLVRLLGEVHLPAPAQRITGDRPTLRRAAALLEIPLEGLGEDEARVARRDRFEQVLSTALQFAEICEDDPDQRKWWCGQMFEMEGRRGADGAVGVSRWEHVEHRVSARRGAAAGQGEDEQQRLRARGERT